MSKLFNNLLVSSSNTGGIFLFRNGDIYKLDNFASTGLSIKGKKVLRAVHPGLLAIYDRHTTEIGNRLIQFDDIHDVLLADDSYYVINTSGNGVIKFNEQGEETQRWVFQGENDSWHINSITRWNNRIIFSAIGDFRKHREYKDKTMGAGFVQDLNTSERLIVGLAQPHSLVPFGDNLLLANSENRQIIEYDTTCQPVRSKMFNGYTRGICVGPDEIYVGLSLSRNVGDCELSSAAVVVIEKSSWEELARKNLPIEEVYEILQVENDNLSDIVINMAEYASRRLNSFIAERDSQITLIKSEIARCNARIQYIVNSRSWRVTKPLRWLEKCVRSVVRGDSSSDK